MAAASPIKGPGLHPCASSFSRLTIQCEPFPPLGQEHDGLDCFPLRVEQAVDGAFTRSRDQYSRSSRVALLVPGHP